jgi:hypothetical protein
VVGVEVVGVTRQEVSLGFGLIGEVRAVVVEGTRLGRRVRGQAEKRGE